MEPTLNPLDKTPPISLTDQEKLLKIRISAWLRQTRLRARRSGLEANAEFDEVISIYEETGYRCVYCDSAAETPDAPLPVGEQGPCVPANIMPCCSECKSKKKNRNIIRFYQNGDIDENRLHAVIKRMLTKRGSDLLREHLRKIVGSPRSAD